MYELASATATQETSMDWRVFAVAPTVGSAGVSRVYASTVTTAPLDVVVAVSPFKTFVITTV